MDKKEKAMETAKRIGKNFLMIVGAVTLATVAAGTGLVLWLDAIDRSIPDD